MPGREKFTTKESNLLMAFAWSLKVVQLVISSTVRLLEYCTTGNLMEGNLIKNSQAVKKGAAPKKAMVKKDVKSKVAAKKWL